MARWTFSYWAGDSSFDPAATSLLSLVADPLPLFLSLSLPLPLFSPSRPLAHPLLLSSTSNSKKQWPRLASCSRPRPRKPSTSPAQLTSRRRASRTRRRPRSPLPRPPRPRPPRRTREAVLYRERFYSRERERYNNLCTPHVCVPLFYLLPRNHACASKERDRRNKGSCAIKRTHLVFVLLEDLRLQSAAFEKCYEKSRKKLS